MCSSAWQEGQVTVMRAGFAIPNLMVSRYSDRDRRTNMFAEFKKFIMRGNVLDLAIGVIIGASFGKIVTSLVDDVLMPVIGLAAGKMDFSNFFVSLTGQSFPTVAAAEAAGGPTLNY